MPEPQTTPPFVMHGARAAIAAGLRHIDQQVDGLERAVSDNTGLAFDLSKTLIESVCRLILTERALAFDYDEDLRKLFKKVSAHLPFLPASASGAVEVRKSLAQTLGGLHTAVRGICELRNACGFASHGSHEPCPAMEGVQALLAAEAADAIVGFLHRVHCQGHLPRKTATLQYDDNPDFNEYLDEAHEPVEIFESVFKPSEILFRIEPETYRLALTEYCVGPPSVDEQTIDPMTPEEKT